MAPYSENVQLIEHDSVSLNKTLQLPCIMDLSIN